MQTREEFLAERRTGIGSSDAAALFNVGYGCQRRLVYQKRNTPPDYEPLDKNVFKRGIALEPIAAQEYADRTGRKLSTVGVIRHREYPELLVHADRLILDSPEYGSSVGALELKTAGREMFKKLQKEGMQDDHALQIQHALMVTSLPWGSYGVLWADGWEMIHFDVERNEEIIRDLRDQGLETWKMVTEGPLPDRLEPDDKRCLTCEFRRQCQGEALLEVLGDAAKMNPQFDESIAPAFQAYIAAKQIEKDAESLVESARAELEDAMQDRAHVDTIGGYVSWKPSVQKRIDIDRLRKKRPEIAKEFTKELPIRALRVYEK